MTPRNRIRGTAAAIAALGLSLAGCGGVGDAASDGEALIGLAMPTQSSERWVEDGGNMAEEFEELGYDTDLQYAEDVIEDQISQIENMITRGADALVIAAIDGEALTDVLQQAADAEIPVISYDRLIMSSEHVDYYATFDNFEVGVLQGTYIEEALDLGGEDGPFNIELFGGSPDDNNAYFFYDGAMSILEPYIDDGTLVVHSEQTTMEQISTLRWDGEEAQSRMDDLISSYYSDEELDAVLSPYDGISIGIISSLQGAGYGTDDLPVVTGQDAEAASVRSIIDGEQSQTVFKDTRDLAEVAVDMTAAVLDGEEPEVNDTDSYHNDVKAVPSYLLEPVSVDADNYEEELIETDYYSEDDLS